MREHFFEKDNPSLSDSKQKIIAAIPAYNEAACISKIVQDTRKHVDQVIVIDDGSVDGTDKVAEEAGAFVVRHKTNLGNSKIEKLEKSKMKIGM